MATLQRDCAPARRLSSHIEIVNVENGVLSRTSDALLPYSPFNTPFAVTVSEVQRSGGGGVQESCTPRRSSSSELQAQPMVASVSVRLHDPEIDEATFEMTRSLPMPPSPNNTVENPPRPQIPIDNLPKVNTVIPVSNNMSTTFQTNIPETSSTSMNNGHGLHGLYDTANFNREVERLKTFEGWRVPFLSAARMAEAGFYYTKVDDIVRCAFCGVEVGSWVEGDDPLIDHRHWSPACRFLRKLPVNNIPINSDSSVAENPTTEGYDTCGSRQYGIKYRPTTEAKSIEKLGIQQIRPPAYSNYATYDARMRSYEMWPISLKLKPNVLSEAGFFYTGKGDQTICYYCGGGLKDWEESDEPWEEHARWFNKCNFVLLVKGKEFIEKVANKKPKEGKCADSGSCQREESQNCNMSEPSTSVTLEAKQKEEQSAAANGDSQSQERHLSDSCGMESGALSQSSSPGSDSRLCKICFTEEMGVVFLPCGHIVACPKCALSLTTCAVCRKPYSATVRAFLS